MPVLENFQAGYNHLEGELPSNIFMLGNGGLTMKQFQLNNNKLTGSIPEDLCKYMPNLLAFYVNKNKLSGILPPCFGDSFQNLTGVDLHGNRFAGVLPESLCEGSQLLKQFTIQNNTFKGTIPACYGLAFPKLEQLFLQDNDFTGEIPSSWNLPKLQSLIMSNNPSLSGKLPTSLFTQDAADGATVSGELRAVVLEGTQVSGTIPGDGLCSATGLTTIALSGNRLRGPLPDCISRLEQLQTFRAASNVRSRLSKSRPCISLLTTLIRSARFHSASQALFQPRSARCVRCGRWT